MVSVITRPTAMYPWPNYNSIEDSRIIPSNRGVRRKRSLQILRVKPASHREYRAMNIFHVRREVASFPIVIVRIVSDLVIPQPIGILEVHRLGIRYRTHAEKEVIPVRRAI